MKARAIGPALFRCASPLLYRFEERFDIESRAQDCSEDVTGVRAALTLGPLPEGGFEELTRASVPWFGPHPTPFPEGDGEDVERSLRDGDADADGDGDGDADADGDVDGDVDGDGDGDADVDGDVDDDRVASRTCAAEPISL